MTGRITFVPTAAQRCETQLGCPDMPPAAGLVPGTIWQCDGCGREWVVVAGAQYNEPYQAWRRLSEQNRDGRE